MTTEIKVMIVDDHPMIREGLVTMLNGLSDIAVVCTCSDGEEAMHMIDIWNPHVILMDIRMRRIGGIEAANYILSHKSECRVLFLTILEDTESIRQALQSGAAGYILKHVTREKLVESIRRAYQGEMVIDPALLGRIIGDYTRVTHAPPEPVEQQEKLAELSVREKEILHFLAQGMTNKEISASCHLALDTVKTHLRNIFRKLGVKNRSQAISQALRFLEEGNKNAL